MKRKSSAAPAIILIAVLVIVLCAAAFIFLSPGGGGVFSQNGGNSENSVPEIDMMDEANLPDSTAPVKTTNELGDTLIEFNGSDITVTGGGAAAEGNTVIIVQSGVYRLTGELDDGRIVVNAKGQDVVLLLDGVNVTSKNSSPLYVYKAASVTLLLNGESENIFTDGESYDYSLEYCNAAEEEPNACIFSKGDLVIRGTGSLRVNGVYNSGIIGKDTLQILNTTVEVSASNNGINGKDSLYVENSELKVTAAGDCLRSTQEKDVSLGWASFKNSNIYLYTTGGDCVQTERGITVDSCSMSLRAGDNGAQSAYSESSRKGFKSNLAGITVNSGTIIIDTSDDAFHSAGDINISGGEISVSTGDDAVHSDGNIYISGGKVEMPDCHEGLEAALVEISGGEVYIVADDDGINASGGNDSSGENMMFESDGSYLGISGGFVYINSQGDGIDSNGDIYMSGGTLIVAGPTSGGDGAIDYAGDFHYDGGLLFAAGSPQMAQAPDNLSLNALSVTFDGTLSAGTYVSVSGEGSEFVFKLEKDTGNIVFGSPDLVSGGTYTVSAGGKYSGEASFGVCSGGSYSGGNEICSVTLETAGLSSYGSVGIGGSRGGMRFGMQGGLDGTMGEGKKNPMGGRGDPQDIPQGGFGQWGGRPEMPDGEAPPDMPEGEAPTLEQ